MMPKHSLKTMLFFSPGDKNRMTAHSDKNRIRAILGPNGVQNIGRFWLYLAMPHESNNKPVCNVVYSQSKYSGIASLA
ncbi:MAG TPA: hypothetical protein DCD99_11985 [Acinetobacter schindleri]|nr:hypothetical protein [Acinetobacter schindleri]